MLLGLEKKVAVEKQLLFLRSFYHLLQFSGSPMVANKFILLYCEVSKLGGVGSSIPAKMR
jgi:hypothetical protein